MLNLQVLLGIQIMHVVLAKAEPDRWTERQIIYKAKEKYRGMFEIQKSGDKTSPGEIGLDIRTHASPKVGQDQVSGGVSVPCRHATPIADAPWKPIISNNVKFGKKSSQGRCHKLV